MTIVGLIVEETSEARARILAIAVVAGVANACALAIINAIAQTPANASAVAFSCFAAAAVVAILASRALSHHTHAIIESALHRIRMRIVEKIEQAELVRVEQIGSTKILQLMTENMATISAAASRMSAIITSVCFLLFGMLYLLYLSPLTFAIVLLLQIFAVRMYQSRYASALQLLKEQASARLRFVDKLMGLLRGAKEIRLNLARGRDVLDDFRLESASLAQTMAELTHGFNKNTIFVSTNLYLLLAAIVFVLPEYVDMDGAEMSKVVATILFLWGSVEIGLGTYGASIRSNDALEQIHALEAQIDGVVRRKDSFPPAQEPRQGVPERIEAKEIEYGYPAEDGTTPFCMGPINLTIEPGEVVFIVGGNGSGKSTLLKVLTGLYAPRKGLLLAGDRQVSSHNADQYREQISVIFSDFHLFSKAYGLLDVDPRAVQDLLRQLQIEGKSSFQGGAFTARNLSTGQRKRLAMVIALLEDRPIFVLDEWAADQDPQFRKYFYEKMIPTLKRKGKSVIAISHDDRYYHCADRVVIMEYGRIREVIAKKPPELERLTNSSA